MTTSSLLPSSSEVTALLAQVELFAGLPPEDLARLAVSLRVLRSSAGTILFREDEAGDRMYVVLAGGVAILKALGTADERLVTVRGPGEFIGEMSLLTGEGRRTATARTEYPTALLELTAADFEALVQHVPSLSYRMLGVLSRRLRDSHDRTVRDLRDRNERLAAAYVELQSAQTQLIAQETLLRELRVARGIQERMLPHELPRLAGVDIAARMIAAREVGGDFYDLYPLPDGRMVICIGDVSGKGVPAAIFMALSCALLRAEAARGSAPADALDQLNRQIRERDARGLFVTVIYGVLDPAARTFSYVRAGHEPPYVWDAQGEEVSSELGHALPLGIFAMPVLDARTIMLPPGATILLCTDGMTEARSPAGELFGRERLFALARSTAAPTADALCDTLLEAAQAHEGDAHASDDRAVIVARLV